MTVSDKEAKEFNKMLDKLKQEADQENDYNGGGAYKAFLNLFYKNKIEDDKKKKLTTQSEKENYSDVPKHT